jgi:hypothetical protein
MIKERLPIERLTHVLPKEARLSSNQIQKGGENRKPPVVIPCGVSER